MFAHFFLFPVKTTPPLSALCMGTEGAEQQEGFSALLRVGPGTPPKYTHTPFPLPQPSIQAGCLQHCSHRASAVGQHLHGPAQAVKMEKCPGTAASTARELPWGGGRKAEIWGWKGEMLAPSFSPRGFIIIIFLFWS